MTGILHSHCRIDGKMLETARVGGRGGAPTLVLLHEALGSVSHWKDFPVKLSNATGCGVLLYSRVGHGHSEGPVEKRGIPYIERQGIVVLRALLDHHGIERPILFGHSEGALIALAFAVAHPAVPRGLILESPVFAPDSATMNGMQKAREAWHTTDLKRRLERHHRDVDAVFEAFITPWGLREFGDADFRKRLGQIRCPTLILQGDRDEYGTTKQASMVSDLVPDATVVILEDCGHTPHRERADVVVEQVSRFLARSADASAGHE